MSPSNLTLIEDRPTHDRLIAHAHNSSQPTVLYVSNSSLPACKAFAPKLEALAERTPDVQFLVVEFCTETSDLFKFAPNQLPVLVLVKGWWARTIMGANLGELERGVRGMLEEGK